MGVGGDDRIQAIGSSLAVSLRATLLAVAGARRTDSHARRPLPIARVVS
jgi:hypothetical protein